MHAVESEATLKTGTTVNDNVVHVDFAAARAAREVRIAA